MKRLSGLLVVTGTIHIEGGENSQARNTKVQNTKDEDRVTTIYTRTVSIDRRAGNVIVINCSRRLRKLRSLKTPYGSLVLPEYKRDLLAMFMLATQKVAEFNASSEGCVLANCMVWEVLAGNRLAAVEGWLTRQARIDKTVRDFIAS